MLPLKVFPAYFGRAAGLCRLGNLLFCSRAVLPFSAQTGSLSRLGCRCRPVGSRGWPGTLRRMSRRRHVMRPAVQGRFALQAGTAPAGRPPARP